MRAPYLLVVALAVGGALAACSEETDTLGAGGPRVGSGSRGGSSSSDDGTSGSAAPSSTGQSTPQSTGEGAGPTPVDTTPAPDTEGKKFFAANVWQSLISTCGTCHETGPGPAWLSKTNVDTSYKMMFQLGYVSLQSRILLKGAHQTTQGLTAQQATTFTQWVNIELKSGGTNAPPNVLEKIGACFDRTKFDAMQLGAMRTVQRTAGNNTNNVTPWNENADNCTGCNNAPCRTCHSGDDATLFVNAIGNPNLPADFTFQESKKQNPAYVTKYFGVSPTGEPIASNAIKIKSDATKQDKAYTHPMFNVDTAMQGRIQAFVDDAIAKYKATNGACQ